jgi:tripartite-type tricarboxylate transporter receptor subunit TctC
LPGFESIAAQGVFAPKGTPREVVNALNREIARVIQLPDVRARWSQLGADPVDNTPAQFGDWLDSEAVKWTKVVRESGAKAD